MSIRKAMNRRNYLKAMAAVLPAVPAVRMAKAAPALPIQLHCDLYLDMKREKEMLDNYHNIFMPAIKSQPGFVAVTMLKLREEVQGKATAGCAYRLIISFETEEARKKWVATPTHQKVWPTVENTLVGPKYIALLYDPVA
jgi:heme-degrading monooxygenase HmoA